MLRLFLLLGLMLGPLVAAPGAPIQGMVQLIPGENNRLLLPLTINGEKVFFLVDSGAAVSVIDEVIARKMALARPPKGTGIRSKISLNGKNLRVVAVPNLRSENVNFGFSPMAVAPADTFSEVTVRGRRGLVHGLFGVDLLRLHGAVVNCGSQQILFKSAASAATDFSRLLPTESFQRVPMVEKHGQILVPVRIRAQGYLMTVDTGSALTMIQEKPMSNIGIVAKATKLQVMGLHVPLSRVGLLEAKVHRMQIGGAPIFEPIGVSNSQLLSGLKGSPSLGLLGLDLLGRHAAVLDFDSMTLFLRRTGR